MLRMPSDGDLARAAPFAARLSNRLARHLGIAPVTLAPATPLVSFTFDDAPVCACTVGADLLDEYGAKGTYYVAGALIGTQATHWQLADDDQIAALHAGGHEIGCHTHAHPFLPDLTRAMVEDEARRNAARLRTILPDLLLENFAYPYGFGSIAAKRALGRLYRSSRGIMPGLNVGRTDPHYLRAHPLVEGQMDEGRLAGLMDEALARKGWLIFFGHDVVDDPSRFGCSPALLKAALRAASDRGIPCVSIAEGLRRAA